MGKGDKKSRRGKLWRGSHGKRRPKPKAVRGAESPVATEEKKPPSRKKTRKKKES